MSDSVKQMLESVYVNNSKNEFVVKYGGLAFQHADYTDEDNKIVLKNVKVISMNSIHSDSVKLLEIGNVILKYQIQSITTQPEKGDFTQIELKDGRKIILIKEDTKTAESHYKGILERVEILNDSTKLIFPISKIR